MSDKIKDILDKARGGMQRSLEHLEQELVKVRAGKASPAMLESVKVDYYGTPSPISHVGNVSTADARTLTIQPYERGMIPAIEKAIKEANLGLNPQNDGLLIRITIPVLTEDRRKQLVKQAKEIGEAAKVAVRNIRRDHNEMVKKLGKEGVAEDLMKAAEADIQKMTDGTIVKIDQHLTKKESEIMHV
jgi:ribosome recycling factor